MAEKSKTRLKLEAEAASIGLRFNDDTTSKDLREAVKQYRAANTAPKAKDPEPEADGDPMGAAAGDTPTGALDATEHQGGAQTSPALEVGGIIVTGPKQGRWRAGRHFTPEPSVIALADLAEGELEMIEADPKLTVETISAE
jgi:hypothetical protein